MDVASLPPNSPLEIEPWVLIGIAVAIVVLRCFARIQATGVRKFELDDWAMNIAAVSKKSVDSSHLNWTNL